MHQFSASELLLKTLFQKGLSAVKLQAVFCYQKISERKKHIQGHTSEVSKGAWNLHHVNKNNAGFFFSKTKQITIWVLF